MTPLPNVWNWILTPTLTKPTNAIPRSASATVCHQSAHHTSTGDYIWRRLKLGMLVSACPWLLLTMHRTKKTYNAAICILAKCHGLLTRCAWYGQLVWIRSATCELVLRKEWVFHLKEWHAVKMKFPGQDLYPGLICKENDTLNVSVCMFPYRIFDCRLY